jgi:hypothetical protein
MHVHVDTEAEEEEDDLPLSTELQCQGVVLYRVNELHHPLLQGLHDDFGQPGFAITTSEQWRELIEQRPWAGVALRTRMQQMMQVLREREREREEREREWSWWTHTGGGDRVPREGLRDERPHRPPHHQLPQRDEPGGVRQSSSKHNW